MKFQKTLMTFLIVSEALQGGAIANDFKSSSIIPSTQILKETIKFELPTPKTTERQKYIINVGSENGFVCHNFVREKEIKDKLFSLQALANTVPELEKKLLETPQEVSFIKTNTGTSIAIGAVLGLITGFFISKK